jgi:nucleotide-binding universal stress UspA family protein
VIADEALTFGADVVVVGSRGHGSIASLLLGSVSAELVDVAPCPVLVARRPHVQRVLLGTDGSPSAARAERLLAEWAWFEGVARRVISVAEVVRPWHTGIAPSIYSQVMAAEAKDLEAATARHLGIAQESAQRLAAVGREAEVSVPVGDPAAAIIAESEAWNADLVVLGSRGQTGLARLVLGSVARNVLHGTTCSVLVVRDRST